MPIGARGDLLQCRLPSCSFVPYQLRYLVLRMHSRLLTCELHRNFRNRPRHLQLEQCV